MINNLPKNQRIIGLDVGDKAIGVAVSDISGTVATPLTVLERKRFMHEIKAIVTEKSAGGFVIGLPLEMDGGKGPRYQSTKAFAKNLEKEVGLPIEFKDERLSSKAVENMMLAADMSRQRRNELSDKLAAAYILQGWLDQNSSKLAE
jgi:putative Holliday junction resolvase